MRLMFCGIVLAVTLWTSSTLAQAPTPKTQSISGQVLDASNHPIEGARVEAEYTGGRPAGQPSITKADGQYSITFAEAEVIETVRYDQSDYFPGTLEDLSGRRSHTLYKTLYKRNQQLNYFQAQEILSAFERIYEIDRVRSAVALNLDNYKYQAALDEIEKLIEGIDARPDVKAELRQRIAAIKRRYGIPQILPAR